MAFKQMLSSKCHDENFRSIRLSYFLQHSRICLVVTLLFHLRQKHTANRELSEAPKCSIIHLIWLCAVYFKSRDIVIWNWACSQIWLLLLHFYKLKQLIDTFDMNIKACTTYLVSMLNIYLHWIEKISVKWTLFKTSPFVLHMKSHNVG